MPKQFVTLFMFVSFLGAFLLFGVQPMVAKMILPNWGGGANVWIAAMFFFQTALLVGYAIAHILCRKPRARTTFFILAGAASLAMMPLSDRGFIPDAWIPAYPVLSCIAAVFLICGIPFILLSTTSPSLQYMFFECTEEKTEPYFLFATSNAGSFVALLVVPFVAEPLMGNSTISIVWSVLFVIFLIAMASALFVTGKNRTEIVEKENVGRGLDTKTRLWVVALSALPSSLLLGVTYHITSDIAPTPMLWVVPLGIYLLTFVVAFSGKFGAPSGLPAVIAILGSIAAVTLSYDNHLVALIVHVVAFTILCQLTHSRMADFRPAPQHVTEYFLFVSIGGAMGGAFNGMIAPNLFSSPVEYPIAIALCGFAVIYFTKPLPFKEIVSRAMIVLIVLSFMASICTACMPYFPLPVVAIIGVIGAIAISWGLVKNPRTAAIATAVVVLCTAGFFGEKSTIYYRSFFGSYRVVEDEGTRFLISGSTFHGAQEIADPSIPKSYYGSSKFQSSVSSVPENGNVTIIGLGVGGMVPIIPEHAELTFIEIDPVVRDIANQDFGYVSSRSGVELVVGDGRKVVSEAEPNSIDVLVIDAFTSDAIPIHLITVEAIATYIEKLTSTGYIIVHTSNRFLAITPEIGRIANALSLHAYIDQRPTKEDEKLVLLVALARKKTDVQHLIDDGWQEYNAPPGEPWTDDFASIVRAIL